MAYKQQLITKILEVDPRETEQHLKRLSIPILEGFLINYRRWNASNH